MNPGRVKAWLTAPALGLVVALVLPTVVVLLRLAFCRPAHGTGFYQPGSFTLEHFQRLFSGDGVALLAFTLGFALAVAAGVLLLVCPLVWPMRHWQGGWLLAGALLLLAPRLAGPLAPLVALKRVLPQGVLAAWLAEVYLILPYAALVLLGHLRGVDWTVLETARGLGARRSQVLRRIALPLALPGIWLAGQLALGWGLGAFLGPELLAGPAGRTLASDLHHQAFDNSRWPLAAAEGTVLQLLVGLVFLARPPRRWLGEAP